MHSAYSSCSKYQISLYTNNFEFWDQICPKRVFWVENVKSKHPYWIVHIRIFLGTKLQFKPTILKFGTKFAQKVYFQLNMKKVNITMEFCISELVWVPNVTLNSIEYWDKIYLKRVFSVENKKNEHTHWILHIQSSLGTNFSLNWQFWFL